MSKARKGKKNGKDKAPKLANVDDAFYRLTIQDRERKIDNLRRHLEHLDTNNVEIKERIRSLTEDRVDKAAELTKQLHEHDENVYKYKEEIYELRQEYDDLKRRGDATIADLEERHKAMHDQLTAEIKTLKAKLQMLEDFRKNHTKLSCVIENEEDLMKDKQKEYKSAISGMERKIQAEKETMQKEIEMKLLHVSEEFTHDSAMRNATYAQRLIRENIALEKEIDVLNLSQKTMAEQLKEHTARFREVKDTFPALSRKKRELIFVAQQKTNLVQKITSKYEKLRNAYTESLQYKNQYQDLVQYQLCKHQRQHQMLAHAKKLATRAHMLKSECLHLGFKYNENQNEIARLRKVISLVRKTILDALNVYEDNSLLNMPTVKFGRFSEPNFESTPTSEKITCKEGSSNESIAGSWFLKNQALLENLLEILKRAKIDRITSSSVETISANSFLLRRPDILKQSSDSLREPFKHSETKDRGLASAASDEMQLGKQEITVLIPKERPERCVMFDVEKGTSFYVSSSESKPDTFIDEQQDDDELQEQSSSYDSLAEENVEAKPATPPAQELPIAPETETKKESVEPPEMAHGTIVDVEFVENNDELDGEEAGDGERSAPGNQTFDSQENGDDAAYATELGEEEMSIYMFY